MTHSPDLRANRWAVLPVVSVALLLVTIDATVLHIAVPTLTLALGPTASQLLWIIDIYPLLMAGLLLATGTLGDRAGHKRMLLIGLALFGLASVACALATSPAWLIAGRAFLALGGAMMMPATLSILRLVFDDPRERSIAIGVWGAVASGGAAFGPVVGGALLEHFPWGAVFLINVPIVLIALPFAWWLLPGRRGGERRPWDLPGLVMAMVGVMALVYAVKQSTHKGADLWQAAAIAMVGAALVAGFLRRQARAAAPMATKPAISAAETGPGGSSAMAMKPAVDRARLAVSTVRKPKRCTSPPARGEARNDASGTGASRSPACSGERPSTSCSCWLSSSSKPTIAIIATMAEARAMAMPGSRNRLRSIIGAAARACRRRKTATMAPPPRAMPAAIQGSAPAWVLCFTA